MSKSCRVLTPEFKQQALQLLHNEVLSKTEAARRLGVNPDTLRRWQKQLESEGELACYVVIN